MGDTPLVSSAPLWNFVRLAPVVLTAAALGACNQSTVATNKSDLRVANQQTWPEGSQEAPVVHRRVAIRTIKHTPYKRTAAAPATSYGIASFYSDEQLTANGETFNPNAMTAAHRSVTVRINDRGPYVAGRVVDVSYSAAESLGIVDRGIAKVKLDVIH